MWQEGSERGEKRGSKAEREKRRNKHVYVSPNVSQASLALSVTLFPLTHFKSHFWSHWFILLNPQPWILPDFAPRFISLFYFNPSSVYKVISHSISNLSQQINLFFMLHLELVQCSFTLALKKWHKTETQTWRGKSGRQTQRDADRGRGEGKEDLTPGGIGFVWSRAFWIRQPRCAVIKHESC